MPPVFSLQIHPDHRIDAKDGEAFWEARPSSASSKLLIACMSQHGWDRELALRVLQAYEQLVTLKARLRDWQGTRIQAPPLVLKIVDDRLHCLLLLSKQGTCLAIQA